jgi:hypothetical protein
MNDSCAECGAPLVSVEHCREYLNEMIKWDFEDFKGVGQIHHLTVLSYNLQHPSLYSPRGLEYAKESLEEFTSHPTSYSEHGARDSQKLSSDVRDWKITGTPESHGEYIGKPAWKILASDVVDGGLENYVENVKKWSASVLESLKESGNLD